MRISEVEPITIKYVDDEQDEVSAAAVMLCLFDVLLPPVRRCHIVCLFCVMPSRPSAVSCAGSFVTPRAHP